jgi:hypothetical protein
MLRSGGEGDKMKDHETDPKYVSSNHPEMMEGEMLLGNFDSEDQRHYLLIGWESKRKGINAYTVHGVPISGMVPVFVSKDEYEEGMQRRGK